MTAKRSQKSPPLLRVRDAREWAAQYAQERHGNVVVLLIGIRDLKQVNERYGRETGNLAIRITGQRVRQALRSLTPSVALLARLTGREFMLVMNGEYSQADIDAGARTLLSMLSEELAYANGTLHISPRIGIAVAQEGESGLELLSRAQGALSKAYGTKGRKLAVAAPATDIHSGIANLLDRDLRGAIEKGAIAIMLQPQFAVADGTLIGVEALARWQHPELGQVGAGHLFASADRCDLREDLSALIQARSISIAAKWPAELKALRLSVNLGADELGEGYSTRLQKLLKQHGFSPKRLTLELTEESLVKDMALAANELEKLRAKGIRIAVDDFGTGYSSLLYLKTLPLDYLKLDKGMTPDINGKGKDRIILRAIIAMAKALELQIIAEGVEREDELEMLRAEGCDFFQGFLYSPALTPDEFERFALRRL
jgi:diguanylate cyclase